MLSLARAVRRGSYAGRGGRFEERGRRPGSASIAALGEARRHATAGPPLAAPEARVVPTAQSRVLAAD